MRPWLLLSAFVVTALLMAPLAAAPKPPSPPPPAPADPAIAFWSAGLKVMNADGGAVKTVYSGGWSPTWAPDRSAIGFLDGASVGSPLELWRIDVSVTNGVVQGTNPRLLYANVAHLNASTPAWSPTGTVIAFTEADTDPWTGYTLPRLLRTIPAVGGAPTTLYTTYGESQVLDPTWNPAGTKIAWVEYWVDIYGIDSSWSIMVLDLTTGTVRTAFEWVSYSLADLDWSRTQDKIAFSAKGGIYTVDVSLPNPIPQLVVGGASQPTWQPDDGKIAFQSSGRRGPGKVVKSTNIWTYDFSDGKEALLGPGYAPDWVRCSPCP